MFHSAAHCSLQKKKINPFHHFDITITNSRPVEQDQAFYHVYAVIGAISRGTIRSYKHCVICLAFDFASRSFYSLLMPVRAAAEVNDEGKSKRVKVEAESRQLALLHPTGVLPYGNALFSKDSIRAASLGRLASLSDELLLSIFGLLNGRERCLLEQVSHACRAFALHEPYWKEAVIDETGGNIKAWRGSWKDTYIYHIDFHTEAQESCGQRKPILAKNLFSDALFLPVKMARTSLQKYIPSENPAKQTAKRLQRVHHEDTDGDAFMHRYIQEGKPCLIVQDENQKALPSWLLEDLATLHSSRRIRAECSKWSMSEYVKYARSCQATNDASMWVPDESPLYLFDPTLARQMQKEGTFVVPALLQDVNCISKGEMRKDLDLFSLLKENRPDNAWIIAGPARSGSGWHVDPNSTSAFNTVLSGRKLWLLLPPSITPPGIFISEDHSSVTAPLSIMEWLCNFWDETLRKHGKRGDDTLVVDVCEAGQTIFVPSQWHHLVINLDESVAFTQNFCTPAELPSVLDMFKNRPEQISGFRINRGNKIESDEGESDQEFDDLPEDGIMQKRALYDILVRRLNEFDANLLKAAQGRVEEMEKKRKYEASLQKKFVAKVKGDCNDVERASLWQSLKQDDKAASSIGFSFAIDAEEEEE